MPNLMPGLVSFQMNHYQENERNKNPIPIKTTTQKYEKKTPNKTARAAVPGSFVHKVNYTLLATNAGEKRTEQPPRTELEQSSRCLPSRVMSSHEGKGLPASPHSLSHSSIAPVAASPPSIEPTHKRAEPPVHPEPLGHGSRDPPQFLQEGRTLSSLQTSESSESAPWSLGVYTGKEHLSFPSHGWCWAGHPFQRSSLLKEAKHHHGTLQAEKSSTRISFGEKP